MSQTFPYECKKFDVFVSFDQILNTKGKSEMCFALEVDWCFSELGNNQVFCGFPKCPENQKKTDSADENYMKDTRLKNYYTVKKLVFDLEQIGKYFWHYWPLNVSIPHRNEVTKVHRVVGFKETTAKIKLT